jgi:hypothetical protein
MTYARAISRRRAHPRSICRFGLNRADGAFSPFIVIG